MAIYTSRQCPVTVILHPSETCLQWSNDGQYTTGWFRAMVVPARGQTHVAEYMSSNLTPRGKCDIAVLNSNAEISLWAAAKSHLNGEWTNVRAVIHVFPGKQGRFNRNSELGGSVSCIHTESLSDHWITHLSWSPWVTHGAGQAHHHVYKTRPCAPVVRPSSEATWYCTRVLLLETQKLSVDPPP
ncbi:uncharacterized protein EDB91DRAFT_1080660 [Suillus paluster]|uniref:uncharacterized protein n=1 Tax=Suillus paluster TaxID=48578 RepID=UPI001B87B252|nr:uncharacterized protein EDB91DRAFT_1080660 [Suillus paluster]KAG1744547.1 hypothetical protein EDB91DRAFT_1080660 [Suillus paluster]